MAFQVNLNLVGELEAWALAQTNPEQAILEMLTAQIHKQSTPFETAAEVLKDRVKAMPLGFEFNIQQVIGHETWQVLNRESRLGLGRYVRANQSAFGLKFVRKNSSNHALYQRDEN